MASGYRLGLFPAGCNCGASVFRGVCVKGGGVVGRRSCGVERARAAAGAAWAGALLVAAATSVIRGEVGVCGTSVVRGAVMGLGWAGAAVRWAGAGVCGTSVVRGAVMGLGWAGAAVCWAGAGALRGIFCGGRRSEESAPVNHFKLNGKHRTYFSMHCFALR